MFLTDVFLLSSSFTVACFFYCVLSVNVQLNGIYIYKFRSEFGLGIVRKIFLRTVARQS